MASEKAPVPSVDDVIAAIRAYVRLKQWSLRRLSIEAGMHDTTLRNFWSPTWSPKSDTLRILRSLLPDDFDPASVPSDVKPRILPNPRKFI